jgi:hypothetical protein
MKAPRGKGIFRRGVTLLRLLFLAHVAQKRAAVLRQRHAQNQPAKAQGANLKDREAVWRANRPYEKQLERTRI